MGDRAKTRFILLGVLFHGPCSGYDIKKTLDRSIAHFWLISYGQIYPILKDLVRDGLASMTTEVQTGKPNRNVYALTARGEEVFLEWLEEPADFKGPSDETLAKLFFGAFGNIDDQIRNIRRYREFVDQEVQELKEIERQFIQPSHGSPHSAFWQMTLRNGLLKAKGLIQWCDETLDHLRTMK